MIKKSRKFVRAGAWRRAAPDAQERIPTTVGSASRVAADRAGAHPCRVQTKFSFGKSRPRICAAGAFIQWDRIVE